MPFLGGSPDGRVIDFGCQNHFGLAEAKCPETKYHVTPLEACQDPSFFCETISGHCKLKRNHAYYTQVQGQMGVSGASWCDYYLYQERYFGWKNCFSCYLLVIFKAKASKLLLHSFYQNCSWWVCKMLTCLVWNIVSDYINFRFQPLSSSHCLIRK